MSLYAEPNAGEKICKNWIQRRLGENQNAFPEMDIQLLFLVWIWGEEKELFKKNKTLNYLFMNSFLHNTPRPHSRPHLRWKCGYVPQGIVGGGSYYHPGPWCGSSHRAGT